MPFKSEAQRRWMWANHPEMARRWARHTPKGIKLPKRVKKPKTRLLKAADLSKLDMKGISREALNALAAGRYDMALTQPGMLALLSRKEERLRRLREELLNPGIHSVKPKTEAKSDQPEAAPGAATSIQESPVSLLPAAPGLPTTPGSPMSPAGAVPGIPAAPVKAAQIRKQAFKYGFFYKLAAAGIKPSSADDMYKQAGLLDAALGIPRWLVRTAVRAPAATVALLSALGGGLYAAATAPQAETPEQAYRRRKLRLYRRLAAKARKRIKELKAARKAKRTAKKVEIEEPNIYG